MPRERKTIFGGYKKEMFGAYPLCVMSVRTYGELVPRETMLGADGSIWPWEKSIDEYIRKVRECEGVEGDTRFASPNTEPYSIGGLRQVIAGLHNLIGRDSHA
jgi:hypothetical protein